MTSEPPTNYLGAEGRIRRAPSKELIEAGFSLEISDAPLLHDGLNQADLAHICALSERGVIPQEHQSSLLGMLLELSSMRAEDFPYDPAYGDAYNSREKWLEQRLGATAGWLAAGRARREAGRIAFRIALRERILDLWEATGSLTQALTKAAAKYSSTVMADYTYLQAAQPTTLGHYLLSFAYPALRDCDRLETSYRWVNRSPGGVGAVAGSRLRLDRRRVAELLGFDDVIEHARDAMWQTDGLVSLLAAASTAVTNASRLAEDLEIYTSREFDLLSIGDEFCRASVVMPHKRNPYALAVIRGGAGTMMGRVMGLMASQRTPSARTDNLLYAYGDVCSSIDLARDLIRLAAGVTASIRPNQRALDNVLRTSFSQSTDLTEMITLVAEIDYRSAYRVVARVVAKAIEDGRDMHQIDCGHIDDAARQVIGRPLAIPEETLRNALDPESAVKSRREIGGSADAPMTVMLEHCSVRVTAINTRIKEHRAALRTARDQLFASARLRVD